ncbi:hypothetical protein [Pseudomonas tolaasii]|uniref:hypothetical protein n=1 Tax=Pseudomonas tolaasii TaxID=29442 RepID=UPI000316EA8F|nr:hypothetical protein [Pseudomonas tolaasii]
MNSVEKDLDDIRRLTRIALPTSHRYVYSLGVVVYAFASVSGFMAEVLCYIDPLLDRNALEAKTGGQLARAFEQGLEKIKHSAPEAHAAGLIAHALFSTLNDERSDVIHAYPITNGDNQQILHRRLDEAQSRGKPPKYFEVTHEFMDNFIARLHQVNDHLYRIRSILRPDI